MKRSGSILIALVIFSSVFIFAIGAVVSLLISEHRVIARSASAEQALQIAEGGANYYRWVLAHDPTNFAGADMDFYTANGTDIGHFTVTVTTPVNGSSIITITSTGWTDEYPELQRTVEVKYGKPSYAEYAFLTNNNVWFGDTESVHGRLHSNGGIRLDGICDSLATTIKETYTCGVEHGCDNTTQPGIWGTGQDPLLWQFPVADALDFDAITLDLEAMSDAAEADGVVLENSGNKGFHIVFSNDGTFSVYKVTKLKDSVWGYNGTDWTYESNDIDKESAVPEYQNTPLPTNGIIFVRDQTWVTGQVNGRVTVAAANLPEGSGTPYDIIIPNNITYYPNRTSGSTLGLIAQEDILVPLYSPSNLTIDAALVAQNGHVFRYYYYPPYYPADTIKTYLETYGTIITNTVWTWSWVDGSNQIISGYETTNTNYDPNLYYSPPPYFPTQDKYTFISWEEIN